MNQKNKVIEGEVVEPVNLATTNNVGAMRTIPVNDNMLFNIEQFDHLWRVAKLFAASDLVPEQYKGKTENCMIVLQMAHRLNVDTMMFMQNTYVVYGKPGMEAKLVIALVNSRGPFAGPIQWKFQGEGDKRSCTAYATHKATNEVCRATVDWAMVKGEGWDKNQKWKTMTDLMFQYRSATFLARLYCPECIMGMKTVDELYDVAVVSDPVPDDGLTKTERLAGELTGSAPEQENTSPANGAETKQAEGAAPTENETPPATEEPKEDTRDKGWRMLLEMNGGNEDDAKEALCGYSTYTPKTGPNKGIEYAGFRDIRDPKFSEARFLASYGKIKAGHKYWTDNVKGKGDDAPAD